MCGDGSFVCDGGDFAPPDGEQKPLTIRELGDFELRLYFNPSGFNVKEDDIKPLVTQASLRAGISGSDLSRVKSGEIIVRLNPAISDEEDIRWIEGLFLSYFDSLPPVIL